MCNGKRNDFVMRRVSLLATISALRSGRTRGRPSGEARWQARRQRFFSDDHRRSQPDPYGHSVTISGKLTAKTLSHDADHAIGVSELRRITVH
jgi:hypothetical protein